MKHWTYLSDESRDVEIPSEAFFNDLESVFKKHGLSLSHEDTQGGFIIEPFSDKNLKWLMAAAFTEAAYKQVVKEDKKDG